MRFRTRIFTRVVSIDACSAQKSLRSNKDGFLGGVGTISCLVSNTSLDYPFKLLGSFPDRYESLAGSFKVLNATSDRH